MELEIILLEPFNGSNIGDIIKVNQGMYNTLINLKKGLPAQCWEDQVGDKQKLVISLKNTEEDIIERDKDYDKLYKKYSKLKNIGDNKEEILQLHGKIEDLDDNIEFLEKKNKDLLAKNKKLRADNKKLKIQ